MGPFEVLALPPKTPIYGWLAAKPLTLSKTTLHYPKLCANNVRPEVLQPTVSR